MNSIVCLKEVPDTETRIEVRDGKIVEEGIQYVVNPYDEFALEEALKWQEQFGGKVTLVSLGPERSWRSSHGQAKNKNDCHRFRERTIRPPAPPQLLLFSYQPPVPACPHCTTITP